MTNVGNNRGMQTDIIKSDNKRMWISTTMRRGRKMALFLHLSPDGFIMRPSYMDIQLCHMLSTVIGHLQTSSYQSTIDNGSSAPLSMEEQISELYHRYWNQRALFLPLYCFL